VVDAVRYTFRIILTSIYLSLYLSIFISIYLSLYLSKFFRNEYTLCFSVCSRCLCTVRVHACVLAAPRVCSALISCRLMKLGGEIFFHTPLAALIEVLPPPPSLPHSFPPCLAPSLPPLLPPSLGLVRTPFDVEMKAGKRLREKKGAFQWVKFKAMVFLQSHHRAVHRGERERFVCRSPGKPVLVHRILQNVCLFYIDQRAIYFDNLFFLQKFITIYSAFGQINRQQNDKRK